MWSMSSRWRVWATNSLWATIVLGSMAGSYTVVGVWVQQRRADAAAARRSAAVQNEAAPVNPFASANGTHLIAYVVTASDCGWSTQPGVMAAIRTMRTKLQSVHGASYAQVSVVGVALDKNLDEGLRFLSSVGNGTAGEIFDQVIVGGSWLNEQIVRFVWREGVTIAASPQVLIIERPVNTESYLSNWTIGVQDDTVVTSKLGSDEIVSWINRGVPLERTQAGLRQSGRSR